MALAGVLAGIYSIIMAIILVIERIIIKRIKANLKKVWIVELILIVVISCTYAFGKTTYYFKVNENVKWFGIVYSNNELDRKAIYSFPNSMILPIYKNELLFVNEQEIAKWEMRIKSSDRNWKAGYKSQLKQFDIEGKEVEIILYTPIHEQLDDNALKQIENMLKGRIM